MEKIKTALDAGNYNSNCLDALAKCPYCGDEFSFEFDYSLVENGVIDCFKCRKNIFYKASISIEVVSHRIEGIE